MNHIELIYQVLLFLIGIVLGCTVSWLLSKKRGIIISDRVKAEADLEKAVIQERLVFHENALAEHKERFEKAERLLAEKEKKNLQLQTRISHLETLLDQERKQSEEKIALLVETKKSQMMEFRSLADRIFDIKGKEITTRNRVVLNDILQPLREQIEGFRKRVEDVYDKESRDRASLFHEITNLRELNQLISKEAVNLTRALKGDSKARGTWGEIILERALENSGLCKGREYDVQVSLENNDGKRFQPDVIVHLPEGRDVIIDSKVSLNAYERYYNAETDQDRARAFKEHINSMYTHIKSLSTKNYLELKGVRSIDFILMFVPIEAAFLAALEEDRDIFNKAFEKNIILVCPSTLLATLRTIQSVWRYEYQNRNSLEIADKAGDLYDKFAGFVEALEDVGKYLGKAVKSYDYAHGRLASGKGNLIKRTEALKALGIKARKSLPKELVEKAVE
jgi:DNA recombination protein RmuC